jgi:hypothetical protein
LKPEYGSHYEPARPAAHQQDEKEIVRMQHQEIQPMHDAGEFAPETPQQIANATLPEGCGEQSKVPIPLPGLSLAQTEFFYALQKRYAKHSLALTIEPDGEMFACEIGGSHDGESYPWGNIHDPRHVLKLIPTMYDATLSREEVISLMFKLFPRSTELSFLFRSGGDN